MLAPWKKSYDQPRQFIKKQKHYFANKGPSSQSYGSPVVMYGCESWTIKKAEHWRIDAFELWCWRRLLRVPWTARTPNQSILKKISPEYSLERLMLKLKLQYSDHLMWRTDSFEKTPMLGKIESGRRGWQRMRWWDDRGWDGWMASPAQWTWVWVNSRSWWWTGRPGVLQSMGSQSQIRLSNWTGTYFDIHPKFLYLIHKTIPSSVSTCDASLKWAFSRPNAARCTPGQTSEAQQTWLALNKHRPLLCLLASHKPSQGWLQTQQTEFCRTLLSLPFWKKRRRRKWLLPVLQQLTDFSDSLKFTHSKHLCTCEKRQRNQAHSFFDLLTEQGTLKGNLPIALGTVPLSGVCPSW